MRIWVFTLIISFSLTACVASNSFTERERLRPLREAALNGNEQALYRLQSEADKENPEAQNQLAHYYFRHTDDGLVAAMKWWRRAADQGYAPAQYNLGYMYEARYRELDVKDEEEGQKKAVYWYRKAGQQGDGPSGYKIWYIWFRDTVNGQVKDMKTGKRVSHVPRPPVSDDEAHLWLKHAAERDHEDAKFFLTSFHAWDKRHVDGKQVDQTPDYKEAYFWIRIFLKGRRAHNLAQGVDKLPAEYAAHLSAEEIAQLDRKIEQWKPIPVPFPQAKE